MNKELNDSIRLKIPVELSADRYVKPSGLSRADAKKIALDNGVVWGCD